MLYNKYVKPVDQTETRIIHERAQLTYKRVDEYRIIKDVSILYKKSKNHTNINKTSYEL